MSAQPLVRSGTSFPGAPPAPAAWGLFRLAGSLVEISGTAASGVLSSALTLVAEAQRDEARHGLVAWVATTRSLFFPPDAVDSGVALDRLILLRLENPAAQVRATTRIARTGAFGLVVVDLADALQPAITGPGPALPALRKSSRAASRSGVPPLSRLAGLAHRHRSAMVLLTEKPPGAPSIDPRVRMRYDASRKGSGISITIIKDKGGGAPHPPGLRPAPLPPGFRFERDCREPAGMC